VLLRDRGTGAAYQSERRRPHLDRIDHQAGHRRRPLARTYAGQLRLTDQDRQLISAMLHSSDNDAADTLWDRYGGPDHQAFNRNFARYGMPGVVPQRGFSETFPYWGFQKATADDLDGLINYTLTRLNPTDTATIVAAMQNVDADQRWGVWSRPGDGAGQQERLVAGAGWLGDQLGRLRRPRQRYTLAIMNALGDQGGYDDGVQTITHLAAVLPDPPYSDRGQHDELAAGRWSSRASVAPTDETVEGPENIRAFAFAV
jgi:hypothetical protein